MLNDVRSSDVVLAVFLVAITAMLLVPLPTVALDFLLVINISVSVIVLLAGLYMPNALALLSFPSLLLLLTLFRLGLNVASTRLILSQGDAGRVIASFGSFLIRGEVVVGVIIFLIITIVNFIVIARGASRVSEVAARFALDALPGKQLAIDADVRASLLTSEQAQQRREDLRKESQLYGSMDGAMKFVQGDAIAGLFIIGVNIIGGMYMGLRAGLSFPQAVQTYTTLTVGDGLVNQIPAILISICAGIVVTRVSSSDESSLGSDVQMQVFRRAGNLMASGALMVLIGLVPGLPKLPFLTVGVVLLAVGYTQHRRQKRLRQAKRFDSSPGSVSHPARPAGESPAALVLGLDAAVLHPLYLAEAQQFQEWWDRLALDYRTEVGIQLPPVFVQSDRQLGPYAFQGRLSGAAILNGRLPSSALLIECNPRWAGALGLEVVQEAHHPVGGHKVFWAPDSALTRRLTEAGELRTLNGFQFIGLMLAAFATAHPEEILSVAEVMSQESALEKRFPGLLTQIVNKQFLSTPRLTDILHELIREGLSVRDLRQIVESIASYCSSSGAALAQEGEFDLHDVVGFIRSSRRRHVVAKNLSPRGTMRVITLSEGVLGALENSPPPGPFRQPGLSPDLLARFRSALSELSASIIEEGIPPLALLCREELRSRLACAMGTASAGVGLITVEELGSEVEVEPVASLSL